MRTSGVDVARLRAGLAALVGALLTLHMVITVGLRSENDLFDLNAEANVPTWVSSALLAAIALGFAALSERDRPMRRRGWQVAAVVAGLMSLDEVARLHERTAKLVHTGRHDGMQVFAWVIPGSVIALAIVVALFRFVRTLPRPVAVRLLLGVGLFFLGALGMEIVGAAETDVALKNETFVQVEHSRSYLATTAVEEGLELLGESVMILTVVREVNRLTVRSVSADAAAAAEMAASLELPGAAAAGGSGAGGAAAGEPPVSPGTGGHAGV